MKKQSPYLLFIFFLSVTSASAQYLWQEPEGNKEMDPEDTEFYEPIPEKVTPGARDSEAPSDAIVLFDGADLDQWESAEGGQAPWKIEEGHFSVVPGTGDIQTKEAFEDAQLHIEWRAPNPPERNGQNRGNSGIFLQSEYEVQVLDSYGNETYVNGQAGSLYKDLIPLVNASKKPGEWQSYDIIYHAPVFRKSGTVKSPATFTVIHNGVLIQDHAAIQGKTLYIGRHYYEKHGALPLKLQDHGQAVSYRNIWIRPL